MHNPAKTLKGILLAGGTGSRLAPMTNVVSKQLLPVYDKPMIYYPLVTLMQADVRNILLISTQIHLSNYQRLLGTGKQWGIQIDYAEQQSPNGLPHAFTIGADFIKNESIILLLGDNIFFGDNFAHHLAQAAASSSGATIFVTHHNQPSEYGVVELGPGKDILSLEEKPACPKSNNVITGAYVFDSQVTEYAKTLQSSERGETEMVDLLRCYHKQKELFVKFLDKGTTWYDTGTPQMLLEASLAIAEVQSARGRIGCPEYTAKSKGWI